MICYIVANFVRLLLTDDSKRMKPFGNKVSFTSHQQEREISPKSLLFDSPGLICCLFRKYFAITRDRPLHFTRCEGQNWFFCCNLEDALIQCNLIHYCTFFPYWSPVGIEHTTLALQAPYSAKLRYRDIYWIKVVFVTFRIILLDFYLLWFQI